MEKEHPFRVPILLQKQSLAFVFIQLVDDLVYVEKAKIDIVDVSSPSKKRNNIKETNGLFLTIWMFLIFPAAFVQEVPPKSGKYEIVLDPAEYRINVYKEGYEEVSKTLLAKPGTNNLKFSLKQKLGGSSPPLGSSSVDQTKKKANSNGTTPAPPKENPQNSSPQNPVYQPPGNSMNLRPTSSKNIVIFIFDAMTNQPITNVNVQVYYRFLKVFRENEPVGSWKSKPPRSPRPTRPTQRASATSASRTSLRGNWSSRMRRASTSRSWKTTGQIS